jgi:hypothetical protein
MWRREKGWRDWRVRYRGLRELEGCLLLVDERIPPEDETKSGVKIRRMGERLLKRGIRRYVRVRITGIRSRSSRRTPRIYTPRTNSRHYHLSHFRHTPTSSPAAAVPIALEIPDFELWVNELWHDFLIEPTPYLVASAICYLGGVLVLVKYYAFLWCIICFNVNFIPLDDEFSLR